MLASILGAGFFGLSGFLGFLVAFVVVIFILWFCLWIFRTYALPVIPAPWGGIVLAILAVLAIIFILSRFLGANF